MVTLGTHWEPADNGLLTVTTRQVVYQGERKSLTFPFSKLVTLQHYSDGIRLGVTSRQSTSTFWVKSPQVVAGVIAAAFNHGDDSDLITVEYKEPGRQSTFDVILRSAGNYKIKVIKVIRAAGDLGLKEAKALVDHPPSTVRAELRRPEAERLRADLEDVGAIAEVRASEDDGRRSPPPASQLQLSELGPSGESPTLATHPERGSSATTGSVPAEDVVGSQWADVLRERAVPPRGVLLASHPRAPEWTERLLHGLTLERLVLMANVQHNHCGPKDMRPSAPIDRARDAELAWHALLDGMRTPRSQPSGWTGAVKLLTPGAEVALEYIRTLSVGPLIAVCACIVDGPYREANRRGVR